MQSQPNFQGWDLQRPELEFPLFGLLESLSEDWDPSSSCSLVVNAQISHDRGNRWLMVL